MNESLDNLMENLWGIVDDLESLIQLTEDLERFYEFEEDHRLRRLTKVVGCVSEHIRVGLRESLKKVDVMSVKW